MSTIDQAAKRLEQLKNAGTNPVPAVDEKLAEARDESTGSVPLRVVTELENRAVKSGTTATATSAPPTERTAPKGDSGPGEQIRVEIDLARLSASGYLTPQAVRSRLGEEFRVVKRPLLNNANGKSAAKVRNANRIMVTSSLPGEGKTFVSLNLAMSLASEVDAQVLLVDADASRPALLERLGLEPSRGLLDLLVDPDLPLEAAVLKTNVERLSVLPAGTQQQHATELLASDGMDQLLERLSSDDPRRIVVFDTPPLLVASEARVLAAKMGQIVMVIAADDTPQGTVAEALATIENCPVVFSLLNRVATSERGHYYGSYGSYAN